MLTFYRQSDCPICDEVADQLKELRLAHKIVELQNGAPRPAELPADAEPPLLVEDGAAHVGCEAIAKHLTQVARINDRWQQHGSDACFCDPDGEIL